MNMYPTAITALILILSSVMAYGSETDKNVSLHSLYQVNPGDVLSIEVRNEETLTKPQVLVRPDGYISTPIVGDILAGGRTIPEIEAEITTAFSKYLKDEPVVIVSVIAIDGNAIYVLGKVNRPGQFIIKSSTDVTQALALAGGITTFADKNSIKILRRDSMGTQKAFPFNYSSVKNGKALESNILLKSGDVILVP